MKKQVEQALLSEEVVNEEILSNEDRYSLCKEIVDFIVMKMEKITIIKESEVMSHIKLKNDFFKSIIGMNTFNTEMMGNEQISRQETINTEAFVEDEPVC